MSTHEPEVVVEDRLIDPDKMMYSDLDYEAEPQFRIGEVSKLFFGKSTHWLRWLQGEGALVLDGREVAQRRAVNRRGVQTNVRTYGLRDIEEIAHALAENGKINGSQLTLALRVLDSAGRIWQVRS